MLFLEIYFSALFSSFENFQKCKMAQNLVKDAFCEFRTFSDLENSEFSIFFKKILNFS
jgi:hypothetical protein